MAEVTSLAHILLALPHKLSLIVVHSFHIIT